MTELLTATERYAAYLVYLSIAHSMSGAEHFIDLLDGVAAEAIDDGYDVGTTWLVRAHAAEYRGDIAQLRRCLESALVRDPSLTSAPLGLGFLAFVEGDVDRALRYFNECEDESAAHMSRVLTNFPSQPRAPRNEPCRCGSGKKRKQCCGDRDRYPLPDRACWLWEKAAFWLERRPQQHPMLRCLSELSGSSTPDDPLLDAASELPVIESIALLEYGLLEGFLMRMGQLLPTDERALAGRWMHERHTVWSVELTEPGGWLLLEECVSGERRKALNTTVSRCTDPGELVYAAVVPTGDGWLLPCHPIGLEDTDADAVVELLEAGIDPMLVASTVVRGTLSATM